MDLLRSTDSLICKNEEGQFIRKGTFTIEQYVYERMQREGKIAGCRTRLNKVKA